MSAGNGVKLGCLDKILTITEIGTILKIPKSKPKSKNTNARLTIKMLKHTLKQVQYDNRRRCCLTSFAYIDKIPLIFWDYICGLDKSSPYENLMLERM
jgi:hypothetical protein